MYWEINISKNGEHVFATHKRSATTQAQTRNLVKLMMQKFPKTKGYEITVSYNPEIASMCEVKDVMQFYPMV